MKKTAFFFFLMMLCSTCLAEETMYTIGEYPQLVPWQATYETHWRTVTVDITPTVPDVSAMPVLMVRPAIWGMETDAEVAWAAEFRSKNYTFSIETEYVYAAENEAMKGKRVEHVDDFLYMPLDLDAAYVPGSSLSINRAVEQVESILAEVEHTHFGVDAEHMHYIHVSSKVNRETGEILLPGLLYLDLFSTLHDIPIWGHVVNSVDSHHDLEQTYWTHLSMLMRTSSSYCFSGRTVCETAEVAADIPLCSFDLVQSAIEAEINAGHIRAVYAVDLGYALYNVPGAPLHKPGSEWLDDAEFYCAPTWQVVCLYTNQARKELKDSAYADPAVSMYYKTLYINAQTGEMIAPEDGRRGCGDYPGIITWADVE